MKKIIIVSLIISLVLLTGCSVKKVNELTDGEKFAKEYEIDKKNPFVYSKYEDILNIFDKQTGIILLANSDDEASIKATKMIFGEVKKLDIQKINYYNPKLLSEKSKKKYKEFRKVILEELEVDELYLPILISVKNGDVINYSNSFSTKKELSLDYLTKKRLKIIKEKYSEVLSYKKSS